ncbi:hypothetical protein NUZ5A_51171 [Candidatus Nitrosotenuis uzonensis]|uniref:Uncharacterized protein n=1 Tax=Candidatus Nitrosotenuis uzonensis TaxID=1407055 RepID=A0A812F6Z1_9ARCH|nr:hypothetical protein NUZ5A_51171 [Candidatus Nitrosotenuis uzonensis]
MPSIAIDTSLSGISYAVKNDVATPPAAPNVEIIAKPTGPQLHAPAETPTSEPMKLPPILRVCTLSSMSLNTLSGMTSPDIAATVTNVTNETALSAGAYKTKYGSKKTNSDRYASMKNIAIKTTAAIPMYSGFENTIFMAPVNHISFTDVPKDFSLFAPEQPSYL